MNFDAAQRGRLSALVLVALGCLALGAEGALANAVADRAANTALPAAPTDAPLQLAALGDTDADTEARTGRYSLLVRQIQLRLAEIGVYEGPIGGVMSSETGQAIRRYQDLASLPPDGRPTQALLEHLTSAAGAAQHLLLRLDRARQQQILDAKSALENEFGPEWARLPAEEAETMDEASALARAELCFAAPTPRCLIREARLAATNVAKADLRDWALSNVVEAQAKAGHADEALSIARSIQDPRSVVAAIGSIAVSLARVGRMDEALAAAERVPNARLKDKALRAVVEGQAAVGQPASAHRTAARIERRQERVSALAAVARAYVAAGELENARLVVDETMAFVASVEAPVFRDWAHGELAKLLSLVGDFNAAKFAAGQIEGANHRIQTFCEIVISEAEAGRVQDAKRTLTSTLELLSTVTRRAERQQARARVAVAFAAVGEFDASVALAKKIDFGYAHSFVMNQIAISMAEAGRIDDGLDIALSIEDERLKVDALLSITRILSEAGDSDRARKIEEKTFEAARAMTSTLDRAFVLSDLAVIGAQAGNDTVARATLAEALGIARQIDDPWARARSLSKVASALARIESI